MKKEKVKIGNIIYYGYKHHKYDQMVMNGLYNRSNVSIGYQSNDIKKGFWLDKFGKIRVGSIEVMWNKADVEPLVR